MLIRVLDGIRYEDTSRKYSKLYAVDSQDQEDIWQARSRAYVHLYLKVMFGIRDFYLREQYVTDGKFDGGVDGYYIDSTSRLITLIQSKFRRSEEGFEGVTVGVKDLLSMQVKRILHGEECDECGEEYNGKIKGLQRNLGNIPDLGRYSFKVVILANVDGGYSQKDLERLTDGYHSDVIDFARSYKELLLPVLAGNLFRAKDISISLDLSNKGSGSKINYSASLRGFDCDITVVFVPIIEIAKLMSDYRNSILNYNPRSYLEIAGDGVNSAVRSTVLKPAGNDFAILNNGITLICDESSVSEQSGRKHRAQLYLLNPHIINGGQTAYTLSLIYDETPEVERERVFAGQEVLVKAIALTRTERRTSHDNDKRALIDRISMATNSQTAVSYADRVSGESERLRAQAAVYDRFGVLVELKLGEFAEGVRAGYIAPQDLLERNLFMRLYFVANGNLGTGLRRRIFKERLPDNIADNALGLSRFYLALCIWRIFVKPLRRLRPAAHGQVLPKVFAGMFVVNLNDGDLEGAAGLAAKRVEELWGDFMNQGRVCKKSYVEAVTNFRKGMGEEELRMKLSRKSGHKDLGEDIEQFFSPYRIQ